MNVVVLRRRLIYIGAMVLLLVPLYFLGNPSVREQDGSVRLPGGTLAQLRNNYDLGQGDLGEIDPASESMRLATLGLRGVAATILWQKAEYYKKEQYWDRLSATLNQIAVLQPHFVKVWDFQSHNLSYNVSTEFDDYRQRYQWVKRGMNYLVKGIKYNKNRTEMPFQLGWFFGNKLGVADEKKQFRSMYRDDKNFHEEIQENSGMDLTQASGLGPDRRPDNWLSGRLWYGRAYDMVAEGARPAKSTMMFYREGPQWLMKYSEALQREGILDTPARLAWKRAGEDWSSFGERLIVTSFGDTIYLRELALANQEYTRLRKEFEEFCGDTFDSMMSERVDQLTEDELEAWQMLDIDRTFDQVLLAETVDQKLAIPPEAIAKQLSPGERVDALQLAKELQTAKEKISHIEIYRNQINYAYWEARCIAEQEDEAILARTSMYEANELLERGELDKALEQYEVAWANWSELFNNHPTMMIDDAADEVLSSIESYRRLLDETDLPDDFALLQFMQFRERYDEQMVDPAMMSVIAAWPARFPGRNFLEEMLRKSETLQLNNPANEYVDPEAPQTPAMDGDMLTPPPFVAKDAPAGPIEADSAASATESVPGSNAPARVPATGPSNGATESATPLKMDPPEAGSPPVPGNSVPGNSASASTSEVTTSGLGSSGSTAGTEDDSREDDSPAPAALEISAPESGAAPGPKGN